LTLWETVLPALVVFLGPYTWLIVSAASETNLGILRWLRKAWNYIKSRDYLFVFAIAVGSYIFAFEYLLYLLPMFVTEDFVRATSEVFLTVEGFIFPLTTQIKGERERHNAVLIAVVAVVIGAMTVTLANFQSLQLHFSSTDVVTALFKIDGAFLGILLWDFALSVFYAEKIMNRERRRPSETEP